MSEDIPIELETVEITNTQEDVKESTKIEGKSMQLDNEDPQGNVLRTNFVVFLSRSLLIL